MGTYRFLACLLLGGVLLGASVLAQSSPRFGVGTTPTAEELRAYCRDRLAPYKVPAHVEFRSELPKTMVGKILRRALAADHRAPA